MKSFRGPPAFVLSQDQTLKLKTDYSVILDVRTSAHLIIPAGMMKSSVCMCFWFHQKPKAVQDSEADTSLSRYRFAT